MGTLVVRVVGTAVGASVGSRCRGGGGVVPDHSGRSLVPGHRATGDHNVVDLEFVQGTAEGTRGRLQTPRRNLKQDGNV